MSLTKGKSAARRNNRITHPVTKRSVGWNEWNEFQRWDSQDSSQPTLLPGYGQNESGRTMKQWTMRHGRVEFDGITKEVRRGMSRELQVADGFFHLVLSEMAEQSWAQLHVTEGLGPFATGAEARHQIETLLKTKLQQALQELEEEEH